MEYTVAYTSSFNKDLRKLSKSNREAASLVRKAITEAGMSGSIKSLSRTKHGENRIEKIEKYDLKNGFRLVVQLVDGIDKTRAFLFVGTHDDAERWLDNHRNYRWVRADNRRSISFIPITIEGGERHVPADRFNLDATEAEGECNILNTLSDDVFIELGISYNDISYLKSVTFDDFEVDADNIFECLDQRFEYELASALFDCMQLANDGSSNEIKTRLRAYKEDGALIKDADVSEALRKNTNTESIITFDDKDLYENFFKTGTFADWMLFLHSEQKVVVDRDFKMAARLRGVSGSGKTCILVHRARRLAKKYNQPVILVTLTESMKRLLELLANDLCGIERDLISVKTVSALVRESLYEVSGNEHIGYDDKDDNSLFRDCEIIMQKHPNFSQTVFSGMSSKNFSNFIRLEIPYVRGRLRQSEYEKYLIPKEFERKGRSTRLSKSDRDVMLSAVQLYSKNMNGKDHESRVSQYLDIIDKVGFPEAKYRCVLCDEVQDFSELDMRFLGGMNNLSGSRCAESENGLFLAGDGVQSIYNKGFVLSRVGIDIVGRSYNLKKNYRNSFEILNAAYDVVSEYEFSDTDEEHRTKPTSPEFASRHGNKPNIIRCDSIDREVEFVAKKILSGLTMGKVEGQICVIAPNSKIRKALKTEFDKLRIKSSDLKQDVDYESEVVKISTIESAKGHEFSEVYILGVVEGLIPNLTFGNETVLRDASRFYVAMTRARDQLFITYSPDEKHSASRFLKSIQHKCVEMILTRNGELRVVN